MNNVFDRIISFLTEIDLPFHLEPLDESTFLPGLKMRDGALVIDTAKLLYPGDILHEAGHLACMPLDIRQQMSGDLEDSDIHRGGEMMAIAWSYAAAVFLKIDPKVVFHDMGYKGGADNILSSFNKGTYLGLPLLQWSEMSYDQAAAAELSIKPFPHMRRWLCDNNRLQCFVSSS